MRAPALLPPALLTCCGWLLAPVNSVHPECQIHLEIQEEETKCAELLTAHTETHKAQQLGSSWDCTPGFGRGLAVATWTEVLGCRVFTTCSGVWDNLTCWRPADIGETVTVPCPTVFKVFSSLHGKPGNISKNCTSAGWSQTFPDFMEACGYRDPEDRSQITFYALVKATYTLGYSVSLASLTTGSVILCLFRSVPHVLFKKSWAYSFVIKETFYSHFSWRLHCTRNYIHLNLFLSFILRAISVLVKDDVLYSGSSTLHCPDQLASWVGCKLSLVFFQYCIMANFYWLLVEGLHLHTLLVASFSPGRRFQAYLLIGWGIPAGCTGAWAVARLCLEDTGCWDTNEHSGPWWVIRTPILISILVNFILFVSILRILLQKLTSPDVRGSEQSQYKRLAKSTLLLIPLFGIHYTVFAVLPAGTSSRSRLLFELCVGSFQGLVVAVLYCFLNSDVQSELRRKWQSLCPRQPSGWGDRLHSLSISRNGSESTLPSHRGSHSPSFLQTETSVI